jgi:hypothetical protein
MSDNKQIKDGLGNLFTVRTRDISSAGDGSLQRPMVLSTLQPVDHGSAGGSYHRAFVSGAMAAGMVGAATIFSFQWPSTTSLVLVRRLRLLAWSTATGFVAGMAEFDLVMARAFTAQMAGGTAANLAGNNGKLSTGMASSQANVMIANTGPLTGGSMTLDGGPGTTETWAAAVGVNANTPFSTGPATLFQKPQGESPMLLAMQEGFIINATVPATGTWAFSLTAEWDEVPPTAGGF